MAHLFSYECCDIYENTFFYRTPRMAASDKISVPAIFHYTWYHGFPLYCDKIVVKRDIHRKFVVVSIHIHSYHSVLCTQPKKFPYIHSVDGVFWMIWGLRAGLYLQLLQEEISVIIWRQNSCDTKFRRFASILRYPLYGFNNFAF